MDCISDGVVVWTIAINQINHLARGSELAGLRREVGMETRSWNLIIMPPRSPSLEKIRISRKAGQVLLASLVFIFLAAAALIIILPHLRVSELDRARLETENQTLSIENKNLDLKIRKLDAQFSRVEQRSEKVVALMETD